MIRINLLPHREQKRKARLRRFAVLVVLALGIGIALDVAAYIGLSAQIALQEERNAFLEEENAKLDKQIAEIEKLKKERQLLLDRKKVVERLQSNRAEAVNILDQLILRMPEGVYLKEVRQTADLLAIGGYAQSSARVSALMRNLDDSPVFEQPNLIEIKAATIGNQRLNEFNLTVKVTREAEEQGKAKAAGQSKESGK